MFSCHCTSPWLPIESCAAHKPRKAGRHVVVLGRVSPALGDRHTSEDKAQAFSSQWCKNCNATLSPTHICTRHPSETDEKPF